jgi:hypothetical protein
MEDSYSNKVQHLRDAMNDALVKKLSDRNSYEFTIEKCISPIYGSFRFEVLDANGWCKQKQAFVKEIINEFGNIHFNFHGVKFKNIPYFHVNIYDLARFTDKF